MKKTLLLGALVASTMAFASMGSVTVKGGLIFDGNSTASVKVTDNSGTVESGDKPAHDAFLKGIKTADSISVPSVGAGLEVEYSMPVYKINDDMAVLVAGGLQGGVEYGSYTEKLSTVKYDSTKHDFASEDKDVKQKTITSSVAVFVAPKFEYKLSDDMKVAAGLKLGLGGDFHTVLADSTLKDSITKANEDYEKDDSKPANKYGENADTTKKAMETDNISLGDLMASKHTNTTFVVPIAAVVDLDYNNIVVSADLGGKVLFANDKDNLSYNEKREVAYNKDAKTPNPKFTSSSKKSPKFIFSAGLKVGYRFDLDKFMK